MHKQGVVSDSVTAFFNAKMAACQAMKWVLTGFMFILAFAINVALATPENEPVMDMKMDMGHSEHEHAMSHSGHEHHMAPKQGVFTSSVVTVNLPEVSLVGISGESASLSKVLNNESPVILNFIFTTCTTICPVMTATFQQVQKQLGGKHKNVRMVSVSIDPENDTPAKLKEYATKFGAGAQWKMLTGSLENSLAVQKAFGVFAGDKMNHKPLTFLKAQGSENTWVRLDGLVEARQIIKELDKLNAK